MRDTPTVHWDRGPNGYYAHAIAVPVRTQSGAGPSSGWHWAKPKNWDKDTSYKPDEVVYVQKANAVVGVGVTDADTGLVTKVFPGTWICLQSAAPISDGSGGYKYHVPQWPLPTPDDADDSLNFWWPLDPACL